MKTLKYFIISLLLIGITDCNNLLDLTGLKQDKKQDFSFLAFLGIWGSSSGGTPQTPGQIPGYNPTSPSAAVSQEISAANGGTIYFNNEAVLTIPPGALAEDTTISMEKITSVPTAERDGYTDFGQAFKFKPEGLTFATDKPASLTMNYDESAMIKKGLSPKLTEMYYYDPDLGRYMMVPSGVDTAAKTITAKVEHFTVYLPAAKAVNTATNPAPTVNPLLTVPGPIRAGAPFYIRFKAYDQNTIVNPLAGDPPILGAIASIKVHVCKLKTGFCFTDWMKPESIVDPNYGSTSSENMYGYTIPASFWSSPLSLDLGAGNDIQIFAEAWDNLGKMSTSSIVNVDVTRTFVPGTSVLDNPTSPMIVSAGYTRILRLRGQDNFGTFFPLIPRAQDIIVSGGIGTVKVQPSFSTIAFNGTKSGNGDIIINYNGTGFVEQQIALAKVMPGNLERMEIRDPNGAQIPSGQLVVDGRSIYNFDVVGYDAYDNQIYVLPQNWNITNASAGTVVNGVLDTTPNNPLIAGVTATLGSITSAPIAVNVIPRYRVNANIAGLTGTLTLGNNADTLTTTANGANSFAGLLYNAVNYAVAIIAQPFNQACHLSGNISGTINLADVIASIQCYPLMGGAVVSGNLTLSNMVSTIAGSPGAIGSADGMGGNARFNNPGGMTSDGKYLYVVDNQNHSIRRVDTATGLVKTFAGTPGVAGSQDSFSIIQGKCCPVDLVCAATIPACPANTYTAPQFNYPADITNDGNFLYVTDTNNHTIRRINIQTKDKNFNPMVTTIAGMPGVPGAQEGIGNAARFNSPRVITTDGNSLYVADANHVIWKIDLTLGANYGHATILAGGVGQSGFVDGTSTIARFYYPWGLVTDGNSLYVADHSNHRIRQIDLATKVVTTIAGSGSATSVDGIGLAASFHYPNGMTKAGQFLYVTDYSGQKIRAIDLTTNTVTTIVGTGTMGYNGDGAGAAVYLNYPRSVTTDGMNLYISDTLNHLIRRIY